MGGPGLPRSLQESLDSTKVSYAQLGSSGLRVSIPILGAMSFGTCILPHARGSQCRPFRTACS